MFEIINGQVIPRYILNDGDGDEAKGFKSEWATLKDNELYVGSMGKEWTTPEGVVVNHNPEFIKVGKVKKTKTAANVLLVAPLTCVCLFVLQMISSSGKITDIDWTARYTQQQQQQQPSRPPLLLLLPLSFSLSVL